MNSPVSDHIYKDGNSRPRTALQKSISDVFGCNSTEDGAAVQITMQDVLQGRPGIAGYTTRL